MDNKLTKEQFNAAIKSMFILKQSIAMIEPKEDKTEDYKDGVEDAKTAFDAVITNTVMSLREMYEESNKIVTPDTNIILPKGV